MRVTASWRESGIVDDAIPSMEKEESDSIRRSLPWANLTKEPEFCGIDEIVLLLARPGSQERARTVAGPFLLCELPVLTDSAAAPGCWELALRTITSTSASESTWSPGTLVKGEDTLRPDDPEGRLSGAKLSPSSCSSVE